MKIPRYLHAFGFIAVMLSSFALAQNSVKCESNDGRRNYCGNYDRDQVRLERQISGSPCVQGQSWGVDRQGLWVDRGCRALFAISRFQNQRGRRHDRDDDDYRDRDRESILCESNDGNRRYCGSYDQRRVRLDRQVSGSPCIEGRTWGVDRQGLWVDRGCRAYFQVSGNSYGGGGRPGGRPGGGWWNPDPGDTWPPRGNWRGGNWSRGGACFYQDRNFGGGYFCLRRGEDLSSLSEYGDTISSVRLFGGAQVLLFDDRDFRGANQNVNRDTNDLRQLSVRQKPGHTWNDRVSSIRVQ